jgi:predicted PurR-regulated permease PerM
MSIKAQRGSLLFLLVLLAILLSLVWQMMEPFWPPVFASCVLAVAFWPMHVRILRRVRRETPAALLSTFIALVVILLPLGLVGITFTRQVASYYERLSRQSESEGGWQSYAGHLIEAPANWVAEKTGVPPVRIRQEVMTRLQSLAGNLLRWSGAAMSNLGSTLAGAGISFFMLFFLFAEGKTMRKGLVEWMPLEPERVEKLLQVAGDAISANVYGITVVAAIQGGLTGIGLMLVGSQSALMWGLVAMICSLIPFVGTALIWVPALITLVVAGAWIKAGFLLFWGVVVVGMSDNFIRPLVLKGKTTLSTLPIFFALLGGLQAFGLIGLIAGPVIFSLVMTLYQILMEVRRGDQAAAVAPDPGATS